MHDRLEAFIDQLQNAKTLESVQVAVSCLREVYDTEHIIYHTVGATGQEYGAYTYDDAWVDHYKTARYGGIDPVVLGALRHFHPVDWKRLDWSGRRERAFFGEAVENGIGPQGLTVPIRGVNGVFAMFSVTGRASDKQWESFSRENGRDFLLLSHYVHHRATELMGEAQPDQARGLSPRERDVLSMLSVGRSRQEAAEALKISEHTFRVYVDSARYKLGAVNTVHAVALAVQLGLANP